MKFIDTEKLIAEIKRREKVHFDDYHLKKTGTIADYGACNALCQIRSYIETLQQEQPDGLDDAALRAYPKMSRLSEPHGVIPADNKTHYLGDANEENRAAFKAGAEWMAGQGVILNP